MKISNSKFGVIGVLLIYICFTACLTSDMPLSWEKLVVDDFTGEWVEYASNGYSDFLTIKIQEHTNEYEIQFDEFSHKEGQYSTELYSGYLTKIYGDYFLNLRLSEGDYYLLKLVTRDDKLLVYEFSCDVLDFVEDYYDSDRGLLAFDNPALFKTLIEKSLRAPDMLDLIHTFEKKPV